MLSSYSSRGAWPISASIGFVLAAQVAAQAPAPPRADSQSAPPTASQSAPPPASRAPASQASAPGAVERTQRLDELRRRRDQLQADLAEFDRQMQDKYGAVAGRIYDLEQIRARMADDQAFVAWIDIKGNPHAKDPNGEHWACVVRKRGDPIWTRLPPAGADGRWTDADDKLIDRARELLSSRSADQAALQRALAELRRQRIGPIEPHLAGVRHLVVHPAGLMAAVPIEALAGQWTISYAPSGTMYAYLVEQAEKAAQRRKGASDRSERSLLALGDPAFGPATPAPSSAPSEPPDHGAMVAQVTPQSNAAQHGIQEGDVLLAYAGQRLDGPAGLGPAVQAAQARSAAAANSPAAPAAAERSASAQSHSSAVPVEVWRDGRTLTLQLDPGRLGVQIAQQPAGDAIRSQRSIDAALTLRGGGDQFAPLPGTRREVEAIVGLFRHGQPTADAAVAAHRDAASPGAEQSPGARPVPGAGPAPGASAASTAVTELLGSDASEQKLDALSESGALSRYRYVHLATHGVLDNRRAMQSALILAQDQLPDPYEQVIEGKRRTVIDGRLTAEKIVRTWKLDADLVTLSACQTGLGQPAGGEGLLGFAQAVFAAGGRSLIVSLWKVDDTATMLLMTRLYENLLGRFEHTRSVGGRSFSPGAEMPKALALQEAKTWIASLTAAQLRERLHIRSDADWMRFLAGVRGLDLERPVAGGGLADSSSSALSAATLPGGGAVGQAATIDAQRPFSGPYYWAAFVLIGDPN